MKLVPTAVLSVIFLLLPLSSALAVSGAAKRQVASQTYTIHPNGDKTKCVGISGGVLAAGSAVTIFDCNGTVSQKWGWWKGFDVSPLFVTNPTNNKRFCLNVADTTNFGNGSKLQLTNCLSTEGSSDPGGMALSEAFAKPGSATGPEIYFALTSTQSQGSFMCVDLTDGSKENKNVLQLWGCAVAPTAPHANQRWTLTSL